MGKLIYKGLQTSLEGVPQTTVFLTGRNLASWWDRNSPKKEKLEDGSDETGEERHEKEPLD